MQVNIYINGELLNTDSKTVIAETKQVNDFFDIKDRQTSYTNTFKLPKTQRNIMLLGGMGVIANTSLAPYAVHGIKIERNGIETVQDGIGYFKPTNKYFNMYVYDNNINLFNDLSDKSLADLNLTYLNHNLNINNWVRSFGRKDYTYPVADYGKQDNNEIEINYQAPVLFTSFIWNKIFSESGFKFKYVGRANQDDFNPFITDGWKNTVITLNEGLPQKLDSIDPVEKLKLTSNNFVEYLETITVIWGGRRVVQKLPDIITDYLNFEATLNVENAHVTRNNRSVIRIKESGFYNLKVTGDFFNLQTSTAALIIEKNNTQLFSVNNNFSEQRNTIGFNERVYLKRFDELYVKVTTSPKDKKVRYQHDLNLSLTLDNSISTINFSSYLSSIKKKDFVKDLMHYHGLMCRKNKDTYEFISFEELLNPLANYANPEKVSQEDVYEDWSHKFHEIIEEDSKIGNYGKRNYFKYKYDLPEDNFGDGNLQIQDQTLPDENTLIQRPYKAPDNSTTSIDGFRLKKCYLYKKEVEDDGTLKEVKPVKTTPYFAKVIYRQTTLNYKISGTAGANKVTRNIPFLSFENLDFNSVLTQKYAAFTNMANYGQKLKLKVYLSVIDIHNLNFFKLKYFKQLGHLYYLTKPIKFIKNGINTIEVIRVKAIETRGEFSDDFNNDFNI